MDCIEHCSFRVGPGRAPDPRLVDRIAERRIRVSPTVADRKGVIQPGKDADFLVVGGDPTVDLAALLDVKLVFRAGQRV